MAFVNQPTPRATYPPKRNKGFIAGLKGNQWVFISPDHKALFLGGGALGGSWLTSHELRYLKIPNYREQFGATWMSQEVSKWLVNGL